MGWTSTDRDALKAKIATGELRVSYQDRTVIYHSLKEMMDLLGVMNAEVEAAARTDRFARVGFSRS
jgi:hypothetical protein